MTRDISPVRSYGVSVADRVHGSRALARRQRGSRLITRALGRRVSVEGLDLLPADGPVILAVNHRSMLDGPLVFGFVERPVSFLVKDEAFLPLLGPALRSAAQIPVRRRQWIDPGPIRLAMSILRAGGVVGIFPEGARGDGAARIARPGVGYLALRSGAAVVPVACHGTKRAPRHVRCPDVQMVVGAPIRFARHPDDRLLPRRTWLAAAETVRVALCDLVARSDPGRSREPPDPAGLAA